MSQIKERIVEVKLEQESAYSIHIGASNLGRLGELIAERSSSDRANVITNPAIWDIFGSLVSESLQEHRFQVNLLTVPEGEQTKSLASAQLLYDRLVEAEVRRHEPILALGGGVVGDLAGFVAATYMRGLPLVQAPTSLVAQVDSSIGGKVAVNHPHGKNFIGSFHQPILVLIDVRTLATLPETELRVGLAEVIKTAFLDGEDFLSYLEENTEAVIKRDDEALTRVVEACCRFKAGVVVEDEREVDRRAILNYGHTLGHALEALTEYKSYRHGEAVAIGMVGAALIAEEMGWIDQSLVDRHIAILEKAGLPTILPESEVEAILEQVARDKKRRGKENVFVLLRRVGEPEVVEVPTEVLRRVLKKGEREENSVRP